MSEELWNIPSSWTWAKIEDVGRVVSGGTPSTKEPSYWGDEVVWFSPADLTGYKSKYISRGAKSLSKKGLSSSSAQLMPKGTIMFSSRAPIGYVVIASVEAATNQGFKSVVPGEGVFNEYMYYYLKAAKHVAEERATGTTFKEISGSAFAKLPVPVAPSNEQHRIVAKIEELFSELDKGVESVATAREQLKAYRQSVLKHAFEGKLTAKWRDRHPDLLFSPSELLARIAAELQTKYSGALESWQVALGRWESGGAKGKRPIKPRRQDSTDSPTREELEGFPCLPEGGWQWVRLGQLVWSVKDGPHYSPQYASDGVPFITGGNVRPDGVDFDTAKFITRELHVELSERCKPEKGDLLYTKGGTTGIARANTYDREFSVWVHVAVLKLANSVRPFYLQHALNSPLCHAQSQKYTHGVGNQDLGLTRMVNIILPLCGEAEQEQVEIMIDVVASELDQIERAIEESLSQIASLRQSILKQAFCGQLVPQHASDEPASLLLERIRSEQKEGSTKKRRTTKNGKKEAA
jgi:type I restriction enzyme, S subunit